MKEQKTKTVATRMSVEDVMELEDFCGVRRLKKAEVIRKAIKEYIARAKENEINVVR